MDIIRRRIVVTIELNADSWEEAANAMSDVQVRLLEAHERKESDVRVRSNAPDCHWMMSGNEDPTITHESYIKQLKLHLGSTGFEPLY